MDYLLLDQDLILCIKSPIVTKPVIYVEQTREAEIALKITHDKAIATIRYCWNDEDEQEIPTNGKKEIEAKLEMPTGTNTLNIQVSDIHGQQIEYQKVYTVEGDISINIEPEGTDLKVTAEGKNQLIYMTYRWDEDEEKRVDINDIAIEETIEIPKGLHTLTIIVVDQNNNTETKTQEIKGVTKPKVNITTDGSDNFIIKASDEEGIKRVEFIINETERNAIDLEKVAPIEERKEFEFAYPLKDGENKLEVIVYNESGISDNYRALINK